MHLARATSKNSGTVPGSCSVCTGKRGKTSLIRTDAFWIIPNYPPYLNFGSLQPTSTLRSLRYSYRMFAHTLWMFTGRLSAEAR